MNSIEQLFERMDSWRHFPNYQLERRADLIFSLYLPQVLQRKTQIEISELLAPEFPVRKGTIYEGISGNSSYKIDYLALSKDGKTAFFIELKTDSSSVRYSQLRYLVASKKAGMENLLKGLQKIFKATLAKQKYYCFFQQLERMGLLKIAEELPSERIDSTESFMITSKVETCRVILIVPCMKNKRKSKNVISFDEFADIIDSTEDPVAARFSASLREWATVEAGDINKAGAEA